MKTIYLIRHAKSDWGNPGLKDFDRPLNERGMQDIPLLCNELDENSFSPNLLLCSPAKRTTQTAKSLIKERSLNNVDILFESTIYESTLENLKEVISYLPNNYDKVALIGHNPGITLLSNYLTNEFVDNIPTFGVVTINLEIDNWVEIIEGIGTMESFKFPKMYYPAKN